MAQVNPIPQGMHSVTPNLTIRGCARAIEFYQRALGAKEVMRMQAPDGKSIWHAELRVGDSVVFMNDEMPGLPIRAPDPARPAPVGMWLYVPDCDAAYRRAIEAGGRSGMEPADMFWGDRTASIVDPFGYGWTFATHVKDLTEEEMRRGGEEFARKMASGSAGAGI
jgi:PhnB protein